MKAKTKKPELRSITVIMKALFEKKPEAKYEEVEKTINKTFPKSKFNRLHFAWYKHAAKRGLLKGTR